MRIIQSGRSKGVPFHREDCFENSLLQIKSQSTRLKTVNLINQPFYRQRYPKWLTVAWGFTHHSGVGLKHKPLCRRENVDWTGMDLYAYSPTKLLTVVLRKVRESPANIEVVKTTANASDVQQKCSKSPCVGNQGCISLLHGQRIMRWKQAMIVEFFEHLFVDVGLLHRTIREYKTTLADYYSPEVIDLKNR